MQELHRQWGANIEARMRLFGYETATDLAAALDVRVSTVTRWLNGANGPSDRHKLAIARLLKCEVRVLFPLLIGEVA